MSRRDQFLRGGAGIGPLNARGEGLVGVLQYARRRGDGALAFL